MFLAKMTTFYTITNLLLQIKKSIYFIGYTLELSLTVQTIKVNYQNSRNQDYTGPQEKFNELNVDRNNWTYVRIQNRFMCSINEAASRMESLSKTESKPAGKYKEIIIMCWDETDNFQLNT